MISPRAKRPAPTGCARSAPPRPGGGPGPGWGGLAWLWNGSSGRRRTGSPSSRVPSPPPRSVHRTAASTRSSTPPRRPSPTSSSRCSRRTRSARGEHAPRHRRDRPALVRGPLRAAREGRRPRALDAQRRREAARGRGVQQQGRPAPVRAGARARRGEAERVSACRRSPIRRRPRHSSRGWPLSCGPSMSRRMPKPGPAAGLPRFVELVRVSGAGQAARDTPEDQRRALEQLRRSRPGAFVERIDEAISASIDSAHRSDLARLLELGRARAFDELRVRHLDRCTRHDDPRERFVVYGIVRDAGAVIVSADGQVIDPATDAGELNYYVQKLAAAQERRRIVERTREAKERLVREGRLVNGRPPWGRTFDARTGRWGIDKATAATYRRPFAGPPPGRSLRP